MSASSPIVSYQRRGYRQGKAEEQRYRSGRELDIEADDVGMKPVIRSEAGSWTS